MAQFLDARTTRLELLNFIDEHRGLFEEAEKIGGDNWLRDKSVDFYLGMLSMFRAYHSWLSIPGNTIQNIGSHSSLVGVCLSKILDDKIKAGEMP